MSEQQETPVEQAVMELVCKAKGYRMASPLGERDYQVISDAAELLIRAAFVIDGNRIDHITGAFVVPEYQVRVRR